MLRQVPHDVGQINRLRSLGELIPAVKVHVLPRDGRNLFQRLRAGRVATGLFMGQEFGEDGGVKVDDAVGQQAAALVPDLLVLLAQEA